MMALRLSIAAKRARGGTVVRKTLALMAAVITTMLLAPDAMAATPPTAASGARCTIVGTRGADVLVGTPGDDVICGLGGDDVIKGEGGNDVLDGGSGKDRLTGGAGNDRVYGSSGNDRIKGDSGNDRIDGGSGNDTTDGNSGSDSVKGGAGTDSVDGGSGGDVLVGGSGSDNLLGESGNDDLDGGAGADSIDGGTGTNWCVVDAADKQKACVYDKTAPVAVTAEAVPSTIDVTDAPADLVVRVHLTDDTGVDFVSAEAENPGTTMVQPHLVSGTVRDGWWESTVRFPRYGRPGTFQVTTWIRDRVGRVSMDQHSDVYTVVDRNPDLALPVVSDLHMSPTTIDVRKADANVTVTARITDNLSGVGSADAFLYPPGSQGPYGYSLGSSRLERVSGTALDGRYRATIVVPKGSPGGLWNAQISVTDAAGGGASARYVGEDMYRLQNPSGAVYPELSPIANGRLQVTGVAVDAAPPQLLEVIVDKPAVDTLGQGVTVRVRLHVTDVGDGFLTSIIELKGPGIDQFGGMAAESGDTHDGWWRVDFTLPQGTPPGSYVLDLIQLQDLHNVSDYTVPATGGANGWMTLSADKYHTTAGAPWDGTITVVENPAAA